MITQQSPTATSRNSIVDLTFVPAPKAEPARL
jgi:hypothetical protein